MKCWTYFPVLDTLYQEPWAEWFECRLVASNYQFGLGFKLTTGATGGVLIKAVLKFRNVHRKTTVLESLLNKIEGLQLYKEQTPT